MPYLQEVGLLPFVGLAAFTPDPHLITALMEGGDRKRTPSTCTTERCQSLYKTLRT
ncbi:hypothetical protein LINGRAHAP2_LOCUS20125 [Linum grandiflorum]